MNRQQRRAAAREAVKEAKEQGIPLELEADIDLVEHIRRAIFAIAVSPEETKIIIKPHATEEAVHDAATRIMLAAYGIMRELEQDAGLAPFRPDVNLLP